jgi:hypothetical protein
MNIVPLISIKKGQLCDGYNGTSFSLENLFARVEKDALLYVIDCDGIEHNNPNLEVYQRLTEQCILWIDNGPRRIDDVMDTIMAGATNLCLRTALWPIMNLSEILELTDDEVYLALDSSQLEPLPSFLHGITGMVVFNKESRQDTEFITASYLKDRTATLKTYLYTTPPATVGYWEERGITGILIDLNKKEGYQEWSLKQKSS